MRARTYNVLCNMFLTQIQISESHYGQHDYLVPHTAAHPLRTRPDARDSFRPAYGRPPARSRAHSSQTQTHRRLSHISPTAHPSRRTAMPTLAPPLMRA